MKLDTRRRKKATKGFRQMTGEEIVLSRLSQVMIEGKRAMDSLMLEMAEWLQRVVCGALTKQPPL